MLANKRLETRLYTAMIRFSTQGAYLDIALIGDGIFFVVVLFEKQPNALSKTLIFISKEALSGTATSGA